MESIHFVKLLCCLFLLLKEVDTHEHKAMKKSPYSNICNLLLTCIIHFFYKQPVNRQLNLGALLTNFKDWVNFNKQQYKIQDIPKMFSGCSAINPIKYVNVYADT